MPYNCQYCGKSFKSKKSKDRHEMETCPDRPEKEPGGKADVRVLEIKKPPVKKPASEKTESINYQCLGCGASLSKGQTPCPACGEPLNWGDIE